jgi:hypothetical protein
MSRRYYEHSPNQACNALGCRRCADERRLAAQAARRGRPLGYTWRLWHEPRKPKTIPLGPLSWSELGFPGVGTPAWQRIRRTYLGTDGWRKDGTCLLSDHTCPSGVHPRQCDGPSSCRSCEYALAKAKAQA